MKSKKEVIKFFENVISSAKMWKKGIKICAMEGNITGLLNCKDNLDHLRIKATTIKYILNEEKYYKMYEKVFGDT